MVAVGTWNQVTLELYEWNEVWNQINLLEHHFYELGIMFLVWLGSCWKELVVEPLDLNGARPDLDFMPFF